MSSTAHRTGTVESGDVRLFYRHFGRKGATPILIFHGANYYDSYDWIDVAGELAGDREVVAWDMRGFGESSWSKSKDYSHDALLGDVNVLLDHFGWSRAVMMGHSRGGGIALLYAARFPARAAGLILVDHCPSSGPATPRPPVQSVNNPPKVFPTIEGAQAAMSRDPDVPPGSPKRTRLESLFNRVEGGFVFKRDPDFQNGVSVGIEGWQPNIVTGDMWTELKTVRCPVMIVRGTRSDRYKPESVARVKNEFPHIAMVDVDSGHDVAGAAPQPLIDAARRFVAEKAAAPA